MKTGSSFFTLLALLLMTSCSTTTTRRTFDASQFDLRRFIFTPLPLWTDYPLFNGYYLDLDAVMAQEKISRFEAVEVQNRMRDLLEDPERAILESYQVGLKEVKAKQYESGWAPKIFENPGDFVAAFDLDETVLAQWYKSGEQGNADIKEVSQDIWIRTTDDWESSRSVKVAPGFAKLVRRLKANPRCKGVVIFTDKSDKAAIDILKKWRVQGIDALFARNHFTVTSREVLPKKDLRIIDPDLKHVILVDDDSSRVMQQRLVRMNAKFNADFPKAAWVDRFYEAQFSLIGDEIEESVRVAERGKIPFTQAYAPYTLTGVPALVAMTRSQGSRERALAQIRKNPTLLEPPFVFIEREQPVPLLRSDLKGKKKENAADESSSPSGVP